MDRSMHEARWMLALIAGFCIGLLQSALFLLIKPWPMDIR